MNLHLLLTSAALLIRLTAPLPAQTTPPEKPAAEALITRLTELEAEGVGLSTGMTGSDFPPVAGQFSFSMGLLSPRPPMRQDEVLTQLVAMGPDAMPALLEHLDDKRETKLVIKHDSMMGTMWYAQEIGAASWNEVEQKALTDAGIKAEERIPNIKENVEKHIVTVGDVCFVALGMITGRGYSAVRYQPSGCLVINSPLQAPALARAVRNIWGPAGEKATRPQLLAWLRNDFQHGSTGAATRLLYFFPDESAAEVLKELKKSGRTVYADAEFLRAAAWSTHEGIRAEAQRRVIQADNPCLVENGVAAFAGGRDPADYENLERMLRRWLPHKEGSRAAQALLVAALASWPAKREATLTLYFKDPPGDALIAGLATCYSAGPLPVRPLLPLLSLSREGYGRYLIKGAGEREKPLESDFLDYRIRDNAWEILCRSLGDAGAVCTGGRKDMDARIQELRNRLKGDPASWQFTPAEIAARAKERRTAAAARAEMLAEVDATKPSPAVRALLIFQDDRAGVELRLKQAALLLHPPGEPKDNWSMAFANRRHFKSRLMDELTPEQRTAFGKSLDARALALLQQTPRAGWPGEDATAMTCLCACLPEKAQQSALTAMQQCLVAALNRHGWPEDRELDRMLDLMDALLERRTPGAGALLLRLAKTATPEALESGFGLHEFFSLLGNYHELPEINAAADYCFGNRRSPWHLSRCDYPRADEYGSAKLLRLAAFRKALAEALSNETVLGQLSLKTDDQEYCWIEWKAGGSSGQGVGKDEPVGVKPGEKMPVRACDGLLEGIRNAVFSGYEGPDFHIYWPLERRNAARKEWLAWLAGKAVKQPD